MSIRLNEEDQFNMKRVDEELFEDAHDLKILEEQGQLLRPIKKDIIRKRAVARKAFIMAKASSDPDYQKYRDFIMKARPYKEKILAKYGHKAKALVKIK